MQHFFGEVVFVIWVDENDIPAVAEELYMEPLYSLVTPQ